MWSEFNICFIFNNFNSLFFKLPELKICQRLLPFHEHNKQTEVLLCNFDKNSTVNKFNCFLSTTWNLVILRKTNLCNLFQSNIPAFINKVYLTSTANTELTTKKSLYKKLLNKNSNKQNYFNIITFNFCRISNHKIYLYLCQV